MSYISMANFSDPAMNNQTELGRNSLHSVALPGSSWLTTLIASFVEICRTHDFEPLTSQASGIFVFTLRQIADSLIKFPYVFLLIVPYFTCYPDYMKTTLIIATMLAMAAAIALWAGTRQKLGKPGRPINVSFDQLKDMEHRDR
jgi:hypothetical protein